MPQMPMSDPRMMANGASAGFNQTYQPPKDPQAGQPGQPMNIMPPGADGETMQAKLARLLQGGGQDQQPMPTGDGSY